MPSPLYLIDASLCIDVLHGAPEPATSRLAACDIGQVVTSAVVYAEVMIGAVQRRKVDEAEAFFAQIPVLPFDEAAARAYSRLPIKRGSYDRLIAAQALALGLTVVTSNLGDFKSLPGLKVEDWTET